MTSTSTFHLTRWMFRSLEARCQYFGFRHSEEASWHMSTSDDELVFLPYLSPPKTDVTNISSLLQIRIWIIMWDKNEAANLPGGDGTVSLT